MQNSMIEFLRKTKGFLSKHKVFLSLVYAFILTVYVVFSFFFRPVVVSGSSMLPTLTNDETVLIRKNISPSEIKRGDIIVFHSPFDRSKLLIKRVIAVGGDKVAIINGKVYVNGKLLIEPYLHGLRSHETIPLMKVPQGSLYVLGDNRVVSADSREFGCVGFNEIYGKLVYRGEKPSIR